MQLSNGNIEVNDRGVSLFSVNGVKVHLPHSVIDAINLKRDEELMKRKTLYQLTYQHKDGISYKIGTCTAADIVEASKTFKLLYPYMDWNKITVSMQF